MKRITARGGRALCLAAGVVFSLTTSWIYPQSTGSQPGPAEQTAEPPPAFSQPAQTEQPAEQPPAQTEQPAEQPPAQTEQPAEQPPVVPRAAPLDGPQKIGIVNLDRIFKGYRKAREIDRDITALDESYKNDEKMLKKRIEKTLEDLKKIRHQSTPRRWKKIWRVIGPN